MLPIPSVDLPSVELPLADYIHLFNVRGFQVWPIVGGDAVLERSAGLGVVSSSWSWMLPVPSVKLPFADYIHLFNVRGFQVWP